MELVSDNNMYPHMVNVVVSVLHVAVPMRILRGRRQSSRPSVRPRMESAVRFFRWHYWQFKEGAKELGVDHF